MAWNLLAAPVINGVVGWFKGKQEIKKAGQSAKAKLDTMRLSGEQKVELSDSEWESLALRTQEGSLKDEYVTLVITLPIVFILVGSLLAALGFESGVHVVRGALDGIIELQKLGLDYGFLMNAVVLAAIGIKVWRM